MSLSQDSQDKVDKVYKVLLANYEAELQMIIVKAERDAEVEPLTEEEGQALIEKISTEAKAKAFRPYK